MPVYIRKNAKFTPDSLQNFTPDEADSADFIQDPDQFLDILPQPYRMIDKVCNTLIEDAWQIICKRENERNAEASKIRPPLYTSEIQIEVHGPCKSLCSGPKGNYIFVGKPDGLSVLNAETSETIDEWKDEKMDIVDVIVYKVDDVNFLISTIDDMGVGRLFLFSEENLYLMYSFNEPGHLCNSGLQIGKNEKPSQAPTSNMYGSTTKKEKPIITKCECSSDADYVGICCLNTQTQENWLEFYKINKEVLMKEIENANAKFSKKEEAEMGEGVEGGEMKAEGEGEKQEAGEDRPDTSSKNLMSPSSQKGGDKKSLKFTAPTMVLKVKSPQPTQGNNFSTPGHAQKSVDETGEVVGTGAKHMLSTFHIEVKKAVFEHTHEHMMQFAAKEEKPTEKEPSFHFLYPGRLLPSGLEQSALQGQPTSVAVWWEGQFQILTYSLIKSAAKDVEHKPDLVWPLSSPVVHSTITPDSTLLALGLRNNNVVVWDIQLGTVRRVVNVSDSSCIFKLMFLDPSLVDEDKSAPDGYWPPYQLSTNSYLIAVLQDGQMFKISCGLNETAAPERISPVLQEWERYTVIEPLTTLPELVVTCRKNGQVFVEDITNGHIVLEVKVPSPFAVFMPWQPVFAVGSKGTMLYIKGSTTDVGKVDSTAVYEDDVVNTLDQRQSLFLFKLRSFPTLDSYRKKKRNDSNTYTVHTTAEQRTQALLKQKLSDQTQRQSRMQGRWAQLKEELELIKDLREKAQKKGAPRSAYMSAGV